MAAANVFDAVIRAVDQASGPIRGVIGQMKSLINVTRGVEKVSQQAEAQHLHWFASAGAHARLLQGHFGSLRASIGAVGHSITEFLPALGVLGAGASLVGMVEMTKSAAEGFLQAEATATKLGITMSQLKGLGWAAKETQVPFDTMVGGMEKFSRTLGLVTMGKGKDAAAVLHHIGLSNKEIAESAKNPVELLPRLADAFKKTHSEAARAAVAQMLFGKSGQEMLPLLMQGGAALEEMANRGRQLGASLSGPQKEALKSLGHGLEELDAAAAGFKMQISGALAPVLAPIVHEMTEWMIANRGWIATGIANKIHALADAIRPMVPIFEEVLKGTTSWGHAMATLSDGHYGLMAAVGALTLALSSPLLSAITGAIGIFTTLGRVLVGVGAIAWANPIVIGVALAAAAAYVLIYHWDKVKAAMAWVWEQMKAGAEAMRQYWEPLRDFFVQLWDRIAAAFQAGWDKIKAILDQLRGGMEAVRNSNLGHLLGLDDASMADTSRGRAGGNSARGRPSLGPRLALPAPDLSPGAYQPGAALTAPQGQVNVKVDFANAPPGTRVTTDAKGDVQKPDISVGYANPLAYSY